MGHAGLGLGSILRRLAEPSSYPRLDLRLFCDVKTKDVRKYQLCLHPILDKFQKCLTKSWSAFRWGTGFSGWAPLACWNGMQHGHVRKGEQRDPRDGDEEKLRCLPHISALQWVSPATFTVLTIWRVPCNNLNNTERIYRVMQKFQACLKFHSSLLPTDLGSQCTVPPHFCPLI